MTVKIKYPDFQIATRSRSVSSVVASHAELHILSLELICSIYPLSKGIRLDRSWRCEHYQDGVRDERFDIS